MTTDREQIIAAAKECNAFFDVIAYGRHDGTLFSTSELEHFYAIAFAAGAASRDAEIAGLVAAIEVMLTHMGMDEDEWNKPAFDQAREALAKVRKP